MKNPGPERTKSLRLPNRKSSPKKAVSEGKKASTRPGKPGFRFQDLIQHSLTGFIIINTEEILFSNPAFKEMTGYTPADLRNLSPWDMVHPEEREKIRAMTLARLKKKKVRDYYETRWVKKGGEAIWVEVRAKVIEAFGGPATLVNVIDISERKTAESALRKREEELQIQSRKIEETNTALRVLLDQRAVDQKEFQKNILYNMETLILPYLERLETAPLDPTSLSHVKIIQSNLHEITSPFQRSLSNNHASLTPRQVRIAQLIRQGKTTKEISRILCVSKAAIDFHRDQIRRKLGITNKKVNLSSFLSLPGEGS